MKDGRSSSYPLRLIRTSTDTAAVLRAAEAEFRSGLDEARAWQRLDARLNAASAASSHRRGGHRWTVVAIAVGVVFGWVSWRCMDRLKVMQRLAPAVQQPANNTNVVSSVRLGAGQSQLADGVELDLQDGAEGTYRSAPAGAFVELDHGRMGIDASRQLEGRTFAIRTRGYEFRTLGTRFNITVADARVALDVTEGHVEIWEGAHALGVVGAGGSWSNSTESVTGERAHVDTPTTNPATHSSAPDVSTRPPASGDIATQSDPAACRDLQRARNPKGTEQCYLDIAAGGSLSAELALFELARLRRDVMANPSGALSALEEYESRFASGAFAGEVLMAKVDLLARLGRVDDALLTSTQLLATSGGRAHAVALRLLRGNLLRDKKGDCAAAQAEYRLIESDPGPRGAEAQLALADCLERLGQHGLAAEAYRSYLSRPNPKQADRARQRLKELVP